MSSTELEKTYTPKDIEQKWYQFWLEHNCFEPNENATESFCIVIPPPNVTGTLHMGHALEASLIDTLIRRARMQGKKTLWQVGTDHAGIATQMVVERQLKEGITRHDLGREKLVEKIWQWKEESGNRIGLQLRRLGASVDWSRERFTLDPGLSSAVTQVFEKLYDEKLIYRKARLVNWDPVFQTAISDLEVVSEPESGNLWHIRYPLADNSGHLIVATTRPETLLGDSAVAVNPQDERYQHLIGKKVRLPLTDREIPIIADDYVDKEFGTGCVKITPAHDFNDYEVGLRHDLPLINIFTTTAQINQNAPAQYQGLDRFDARKKIVADLTQLDLLEKVEPHTSVIPRGDRSNSVVEPYLTEQWYVKIESLAKPAIEAVENKAIQFVPENYENMYFSWMHDIKDWCISRQLWWGHRIPAWYDQQNNIYVAQTEQAAREKYQLADSVELRQDDDVLDTWFSSALWPFASLGWPDQKDPAFKDFYPTTMLVTGFDIIFFWVARMIMMGLKFTDTNPFEKVYIHGLIRDSEGQKMSKSKGNVIDPLDIVDGIDLESLVAKRTSGLMQPQKAQQIEKATRKEFPEGIPEFGTDALRFMFCSLPSTTRFIQFDMPRLEGYRNFCNKLWNAARFIQMNTVDFDPTAAREFTSTTKWIHARLQQTINTVNTYLDDFRFDLAAQAIYEFTWYEFCDWYVELSKSALQNKDNAALRAGVQFTLLQVMEIILRLAHPMIPFVTEEIWQQLAPKINANTKISISLCEYPKENLFAIDEAAINEIEWLKKAIIGIRTIRSEMNVSPSKIVPSLVQNGNEQDIVMLTRYGKDLQSLAKIDSIQHLEQHIEPPPSAMTLVGELKILIPLAGLIDKDAELARLKKEIGKVQKELEKCHAKLSNENYISKAPVEVVALEKQRVAEFEKTMQELREQEGKIAAI
jgi:valyl-tRNA synthetase